MVDANGGCRGICVGLEHGKVPTRDFLGGWNAQGSNRYTRLARRRIFDMQLAVLRSLSQPELQDPLGESDTVIEFAEYLTTLTGEEEHKAKILRTQERCPRLLPSRFDSLSTQLPDLEEHQEVPYIEEDSGHVITEPKAKRKRGGHAQVRTQELGTDPRARRQEIRASLRPGFYVCYSGKKSIRTLHKLGMCYALPDVDYIRYEYMGTDFPAGAYDVICKLCSRKNIANPDDGSDHAFTSSSTDGEPD